MKKTIALLNSIYEKSDGSLVGGFASIKGGKSLSNKSPQFTGHTDAACTNITQCGCPPGNNLMGCTNTTTCFS